jgi:hypothetical protein
MCLQTCSCPAGDNDWTYPFVWWRNLDKLIHHVNKVHAWSYLLVRICISPVFCIAMHGDACSVCHHVLQCRMGG